MGCTSSTEVTTDPYTGQKKVKKRLGGAYPGQKIPQHGPYVPPASAFGKDGQATAHFVTHGGGNALTLVQCDGSTAPQVGGSVSPPQMIQVTLPDGVSSGQTIHVQAPDGRMNAIVVPTGFGPGSTFMVEFAPPEATMNNSYGKAASSEAPYINTPSESPYYTTGSAPTQGHSAIPPPASGGDDGFASGFGTPTARAVNGSGSGNYPTTSATLY